MGKLKVAFVCVGNSCRSQIAEGFARNLGEDVFEVYSAGTNPASNVSSNAITVMKDLGIDISNQHPKGISDIPSELDIIITMGCDVDCSITPGKPSEDWGLDDPCGQQVEVFRKIRDIIEFKVRELIQRAKDGEFK